MLGAGQPPRSRQRDVDGLGLERRITRPRAGRRVQQRLHQFLQRVEALPSAFFASAGAAFSHRSETSLSRPCLRPSHSRRNASTAASQSAGRGLARLRLKRGKRLVQRGIVKCRSDWVLLRSSCVKSRIKHCMQQPRA